MLRKLYGQDKRPQTTRQRRVGPSCNPHHDPQPTTHAPYPPLLCARRRVFRLEEGGGGGRGSSVGQGKSNILPFCTCVVPPHLEARSVTLRFCCPSAAPLLCSSSIAAHPSPPPPPPPFAPADNKFSSFQRQLNLYGFRKIVKGRESGCYMHPSFLRDRPDLLSEVRQDVKGTLQLYPRAERDEGRARNESYYRSFCR